jgi:Mycolic acid cyclopropane synthetase
VTLLVNTLEHATSGRLVIESISNIGPHYARTLREWRHRFENNFGEIERALRKDYPSVFDDDHSGRGGEQRARDELAVFRRKWLCKTSQCHHFSCLLNLGFFFSSYYSSTQITCKFTLFCLLLSLRKMRSGDRPFRKLNKCFSSSCYCEIGFTTRMLGGKSDDIYNLFLGNGLLMAA